MIVSDVRRLRELIQQIQALEARIETIVQKLGSDSRTSRMLWLGESTKSWQFELNC